MPYDLTGYDSAGVRHDYVMDDAGALTGDDPLLPDWLGDNPLPPIAGDRPTDAELDAIRQHASKLLTFMVVAYRPPPEEVAPEAALTDPPAPDPLV